MVKTSFGKIGGYSGFGSLQKQASNEANIRESLERLAYGTLEGANLSDVDGTPESAKTRDLNSHAAQITVDILVAHSIV